MTQAADIEVGGTSTASSIQINSGDETFGAALPGPDEMPDGPYGVAARAYWDAGWQPLPLPWGKKTPPPKGYTGKTAHSQVLTADQVQEWGRSKAFGNIAVRMPPKVVGIDVDAYLKCGKVKDGETTLRQIVEKYGPLPKTVMSTARPDSVGHLLYRLPFIPSDEFPAELGIGQIIVLPGVLGPGIEAIQHHHRYSVVWPSTNPDADGAVYRWWLPNEDYEGDDFWESRRLADEGFIPRVEDLPELPEAWCHVRTIGGKQGVVRGDSAAPLGSYEVQHLLDQMATENDLDPKLAATILSTYQSAVTSGKARHDSCLSALTWAFKAGAAGLIDPAPVVDTLDSMFASDTHDRYVPGEFASMAGWAAANGPTDSHAYRAKWDEKNAWRAAAAVSSSIPAQASALTEDAQETFSMPTFHASDYKTVTDENGTRQVLTEATKARIVAQTNSEAVPEEPAQDAPEQPRIPGRIPPSFWDRRPVLKHIRQAAHSQCCSSDVFLYAYMARMSAMLDHRIRVNTGAKQPVCPNIYVGICAKSGTNKSSSVAGSRDLTYAPEHRDILDGVPIGTGEGMAEGLMGTVQEDDPDGKTTKDGTIKQVAVRKQVRHNIFFDVDEGETLIRLGSRDGSSLWPSIRSAWTGGPLGQLNATAERNRVIPPRSYTISMIVGFQYSNALKVIQDDETGTAQRFVWCNAVDPDIPMDPVDWPGELPHYPQEMTLSLGQLSQGAKAERLIEMPLELKRMIRRDIVLRGRGDDSIDSDKLNAHANLSMVKLSALLALMEGRDEISMEDWELAEILWQASCELRSYLIDEAKREAEEKLREKNAADLNKAITTHTAKAAADRSIEIRARWVWEKVSDGARTLGELNKKLGSGIRHTLRPGVELAVVRDWVRLNDEGELSVGPSQPGGGT